MHFAQEWLGKLSTLKSLPLLSKLSPSSARVPTSEEKEGYRKAQRLAYACATEIAQELKEGWTEKQAADLMDTYLMDHGVKAFFHRSVAWFGDRSRFQDFNRYYKFLPTDRPYREDEVAILDTSPIVETYTADIGYTFCRTPNPELVKAKKLLLEFRDKLPALFMSDRRVKDIWREVDEELKSKGYDNCHSQYPMNALGHRLYRMPLSNLPGITFPFGLHAYWAGITRGLFPEILSPTHVGDKIGLWAVEPHLGGAGFGAKFEEILVVEENQAYWLDDEVPHMQKDWVNS